MLSQLLQDSANLWQGHVWIMMATLILLLPFPTWSPAKTWSKGQNFPNPPPRWWKPQGPPWSEFNELQSASDISTASPAATTNASQIVVSLCITKIDNTEQTPNIFTADYRPWSYYLSSQQPLLVPAGFLFGVCFRPIFRNQLYDTHSSPLTITGATWKEPIWPFRTIFFSFFCRDAYINSWNEILRERRRKRAILSDTQ